MLLRCGFHTCSSTCNNRIYAAFISKCCYIHFENELDSYTKDAMIVVTVNEYCVPYSTLSTDYSHAILSVGSWGLPIPLGLRTIKGKKLLV
jgi:hypothetical protein